METIWRVLLATACHTSTDGMCAAIAHIWAKSRLYILRLEAKKYTRERKNLSCIFYLLKQIITIKEGFSNMLTNTFGNAAGAQSMFQPGFAGTDGQQVRNQINRDLMNYGAGMQAGYGAGLGYGYQGVAGVPGSIPATGPQAVFQPGFAGTDVQRVRNQIARDVSMAGMQSGYGTSMSTFGDGMTSGYGTGMSTFGDGMTSGFGTGMMSNYGYQGNVGVAGNIPAAGPQAIFQPGFAGTDGLRVRNQIARDVSMGGMQSGYGTGMATFGDGMTSSFGAGMGTYGDGMTSGLGTGMMSNYGYQGAIGVPGSIPATGPQAIFQPGFAGTDVLRVRNQIARDVSMGGMQSGFAGQAAYPGAFAAQGMNQQTW